MDEEQYIEGRLKDQIDWYDKKSASNQKWYKRLRIIEILLASSIPFLAGFVDVSLIVKFIIAGSGVAIALNGGLLLLYKFQENWTEYRTTSETLKHHMYRFLTKSVPYDGDDAFKLLVDNVESLISKENSNWNNYIVTQKTEDEDG